MTGADGGSATAAVVVVNWNTKELVDECVTSVIRRPAAGVRTQVVVVDNGSSDGSAEHIGSRWPGVLLIANPDNRGFAQASNQGIRATDSEYVLLLNSDAQLTAGCLELLVGELDNDPRAAAAGARLESLTGRWQRTAAGQAPSLRSSINHYLFLERLFPASRAFRGLYLVRDGMAPLRVDWVSGACMLIRRRALDQVGLLDERYFMYMDDVELCDRFRAAGWSIAYVPGARAIHREGHSSLRAGGVVKVGALRSFHRYFEQRHGPRQLAMLRAVQVVGYGVRTLAFAVAGAVRREPGLALRASQNLGYLRFAIGAGIVGGPNDNTKTRQEARS